MSDEIKNVGIEEEEDIITLEFDDNTAVDCFMMGVFEANGKEYIALEPTDDSEEVYIYGYKEIGDDEFELVDIVDDAEFDAAAAEFDAIMAEAEEPAGVYCVANLAEVELQSLPGFKVIRKVKVNDKGEFVTKIKDEDPDCRVFSRCKIGEKILLGTAYIEWNKFENAYSQSVMLSDDYTTVVGRCVDTNGLPVVDARVDVDVVTTPTEVDGKSYKTQVGRTDKDGRWIVEGVDKPAFGLMLMRLSNTNVVNREDSRVPPYGIKINAYRIPKFKVCGSDSVPNVTARDRAAAERIFAAYKRKTGKEWPRPAPMTDFPVSTNNVIYVPDIVLK